MTKEIEALETLDEYSDEQYSAFLEYTALKDQCLIEPTTLYIDNNHEFFSEWSYFSPGTTAPSISHPIMLLTPN